MNKCLPGLVGILLLLFGIESAIADDFTGSFVGQLDGEEYRLVIRAGAGKIYEGELSAGGETVPLGGRRFGEQMMGQVGFGADGFGFVARIKGSLLELEDQDGKRILFRRAGSAGDGSSPAQAAREVYVNRTPLDPETLQALESQSQLPIASGRYWYDSLTGAWGVENGPTAGLVLPGLPLPGPMPADISGGGTGIFINGREIHPLDQQALYQLFGVTYQGNFWMDAQGNIGYVGGPAIVNLLQASQAARSGGDSTTHGYDSTYGARGTLGGGMYSGRTATGKSVFWYPGM